MFFPPAQITFKPSSCAFFEAIGSNGQFFPGTHSSPTIFLKSLQEILSIGFASGFLRGSSVYTFSMFERFTTVSASNLSARRTASICLLKIQFSDLNSHFRSADFKSSQYAKGRRSVRVRSCGYFIVYAAQFLRSAHGASFVAVLVHILGILDMIGSFALYPAKAGDIDHIRQFIIVSY